MAFSKFANREEAGRKLAELLQPLNLSAPLVLAIPRGGVPVARAIAKELKGKLDLAPDPDGSMESKDFSSLTADRDGSERGIDPKGREVVLADDGAATGTMAVSAYRAVKALGASRIVFACPVVSREAVHHLREERAEVVVLHVTKYMPSVGEYYEEFEPVSEAEAQSVRQKAKQQRTQASSGQLKAAGEPREVDIDLGEIRLGGTLTIPSGARGIIVFAHGSGSSRHSPRNQAVARALNENHFATLLMDLLTEDEARNRNNVFDIPFLARRVRHATEWLSEQPETSDLRVGYFGASTGAAAALVAAAALPETIRAVVSRGGRPDLAKDYLDKVNAPTLFIVGELDEPVLTWNREAYTELNCEKSFATVEGATHLFEEPGTLDEVIVLARKWFEGFLGPASWSHSARSTSSTDQPKR